MTGSVRNRHALLPVTFLFGNSPTVTIEFVVDTGFTDFLTLPPAAVATLALPFLHRISADLADDSTVSVDVHLAAVLWGGIEREIPVVAMGRRPPLGTAMLSGQELVVPFTEGGVVTIENLQPGI